MLHELLHMNEEVAQALFEKKPVLALESSIIAQSLPFPDNLLIMQLLEQKVREAGACPATLGLLNGKIHVGINPSILEQMSQSKNIILASRRDIPFILYKKLTACTTVAASVFCANFAGIPFFVTGIIGGIHNQNEEYMDASKDLTDIVSSPVTIICSGVKSILDLPKTLEILENQGVPILGFNDDRFPALNSHSDDNPIIPKLETPEEIADILLCQDKLNTRCGMVVTNPTSKLAETSDSQILPMMEQAQRESKNPKTITAFLLQRITELTLEQSIQANIELIKNNILLASQIAIAYQIHQN
jgi:pseudouridine-5'-phosphate glycosidase